MPQYRIAVLPGDGIGPEVIDEAVKLLRCIERLQPALAFDLEEWPAGAAEYLRSGDPLPEATLRACRQADAILLGAMGLPDVRWPSGTEIAPQLDLREQLDLFAGVRPVFLFHPAHSPLRGYQAGQIDLVIFRENTEGLFATRKQPLERSQECVADALRVTRRATERICRAAFHRARQRRKRVTLVDKANVLASMAFFRSVFDQVAQEFADVIAERIYVDAAALYLVRNPARFDVLVMENLFGDILSDLAAGLVGGMGMAPSGDIGDKWALFQPAHGSAPDIAGRGIANPVAAILSAAMMLEWLASPESVQAADWIRRAVEMTLADPAHTTPDLGGALSTRQLGERIAANMEKVAQCETDFPSTTPTRI